MDPNAGGEDAEGRHRPPSVGSKNSAGGAAKSCSSSSHETTASMDDFSGGSVSSWVYDEIVARGELMKLIVSQDLPITIGESRYFESMIHRGFRCPQYEKIDSCFTVSDIFLHYGEKSAELKERFSNGNFSFALTSDMWATSYHRMNYLSVAAHYVDENYSLNKRVIGFRLIDGAPTAEVVGQCILDVARSYNIENRIISVTLGNDLADAKTMEALAPLLQSYTGGFVFQQRCICHILNDTVQAGMAEMAEPLDTLRSAIGYIFSSEKNSATFESYCKEQGKEPRKFWPDSKVRWDSTYEMLKGVLPYKEVLTSFASAHLQQEFLSEHNWSLLSMFHKFLETFYEATTNLSDVYIHTSALALNHICEIAHLFQSYRTDHAFSTIVKPMEAMFVKYFQSIPHLYCYGFILDPRIKLSGLEQALKFLGDALNIDYSSTYSQVADEFLHVLSMYEEKFGSLLRPPPMIPKSVSKIYERFYKRLKLETLPLPSSSELSVHQQKAKFEFDVKYNKTDYVMDLSSIESEDDANLFMWWKDHKSYCIVLAQLASDVLAAPVSTVSSADAFSINGRLVEDRRSCLAPEMVEAITCLKDWQNAATREQHSMVNTEFASELGHLNLESK